MSTQQTRDIISRSLEVTTDAPLPPTLAIISPTPRSFTFPINSSMHHDSPFSSPSQSPFEPESHPFVSSSCTPPPPSTFFRTLSPHLTPTDAFNPSPSSPMKRRKSSCAGDLERRPKKGDEDYIKRPENAFILFRRKCCEERQALQAAADGPGKKQRQADLSKTISQQWKSLPSEERHHWEELAKEKKKEHEAMHPGYVYRPQRSTKKEDARSKSKTRKPKGIRGDYEHQDETDHESVTFMVPHPQASTFSRRHGRSASAPTPQPYQSIQVPNVYMGSCPTSPSLLPMITQQRAGHPDHGGAMCFDYLPAPSFVQTGPYEASLQSSDFFQNMFGMSQVSPPVHRGSVPTLSPLSMVQTYTLLPAHQIVSPAESNGSRSSSPSSCHSGPFTPTTGMLANSFSQLGYETNAFAEYSQSELEAGAEAQALDMYSTYSWETNSIWPTTNEMLMGDDFDLSSIPPIELGNVKFDVEGELNLTLTNGSSGPQYVQDFSQEDGQYHPRHHQNNGVFSLDDFLSAGHGY